MVVDLRRQQTFFISFYAKYIFKANFFHLNMYFFFIQQLTGPVFNKKVHIFLCISALNMYLPLSKIDFSCNYLFKYIFKSTI